MLKREPIRFLLVDDEPFVLLLLKLNLETFSSETHTASDGLEALSILNAHAIDCIICDINMPKLNGIELIKKIRKMEINTPFIFYSAHGTMDIMRIAIEMDVYDFINKPNVEELENSIRTGINEAFHAPCVEKVSKGTFISPYRRLRYNISI